MINQKEAAQRIAEIKDRLKKAGPERWEYQAQDPTNPRIIARSGGGGFYYLDMLSPLKGPFIAEAKQDIPFLLGLIEELQAEVERMRKDA